MTQRSRGRPPKYPIEEVRQRLIDSARESLRQHGVTSGLDAVTLDGAIHDADVPRGSAYRMWQSDESSPQDAFRREVALDLLRTLPASYGLPSAKLMFGEMFEELTKGLDNSDPDAMRPVLLELIRVVASSNFEMLDGDDQWMAYSAIRTASMSRRGSDPELDEAVRFGEEKLMNRYADLYREIATAFGHTIRPPFTYGEFSAAAYAMNEGLGNRASTTYRRRDIPLVSDLDGEEKMWTLTSCAFVALAEYFFIPVSELPQDS